MTFAKFEGPDNHRDSLAVAAAVEMEMVAGPVQEEKVRPRHPARQALSPTAALLPTVWDVLDEVFAADVPASSSPIRVA